MRRIVAVMILVPVMAQAGPLEDACHARGTWDAATCTCMQGVGDQHLDGEDQTLAAAYFQRRITSAQIAAEHGTERAQSFLLKLSQFMESSTAQCGAP